MAPKRIKSETPYSAFSGDHEHSFLSSRPPFLTDDKNDKEDEDGQEKKEEGAEGEEPGFLFRLVPLDVSVTDALAHRIETAQ